MTNKDDFAKKKMAQAFEVAKGLWGLFAIAVDGEDFRTLFAACGIYRQKEKRYRRKEMKERKREGCFGIF